MHREKLQNYETNRGTKRGHGCHPVRLHRWLLCEVSCLRPHFCQKTQAVCLRRCWTVRLWCRGLPSSSWGCRPRLTASSRQSSTPPGSEALAYEDRRHRREDGLPAKRDRDWSSGGAGGHGGWAAFRGRRRRGGDTGAGEGGNRHPGTRNPLPPPTTSYWMFFFFYVSFLYLPMSEPHWRNYIKPIVFQLPQL